MWAGAFNAVGGYCACPHQDAMMVWYVTAKPYHVSVLCTEVCDLGRSEWSYRCYTGPAFEKTSIFLTL